MSGPSAKVVYENAWLRVVSKPMSAGSDASSDDYFVVEVPDWAMICPRVADGRFILVEQYRPPVERTVLEFPAGRIDPGETVDDSIRRELVEETGHRATRVVSLGTYFTDTGRLNNRAHLFYGDAETVPGWTPEHGVVPVLLAPAEIDQRIADGRIVTLHHIGMWLLVKAAGLAA
jgi:ADP-ribose pyrophosphatase